MESTQLRYIHPHTNRIIRTYLDILASLYKLLYMNKPKLHLHFHLYEYIQSLLGV